jgi:hypothetical protein
LRDACMATVAALATSRTNMLIYDNINLMSRIAEQILGRKSELRKSSRNRNPYPFTDAQENGTCATLIPL